VTDPLRLFKVTLLALSLLFAAYFCFHSLDETRSISGLLYADGQPVGGDFINLWSVGKLTLAGRAPEIYRWADFQAFEEGLTGAPIGLRTWAYPPHSLLLAWPFGLVGFYAAMAAWSALGLVVLGLGARRLGFDALETGIILLSPASVMSLYYGQTGNLATGFMLLALSGRSSRDLVSPMAAALLTLKPQAGFLLPLLWVFQRRWWAIVATAVLSLGLVALALALFGPQPWRDYLFDTLPVLSKLERHGTGPFMTMIPSAFMALRILTHDGDLALLLHAGFAVLVGVVLVTRLARVDDALRRAAMVLIATTLMTPYLHNYDLGLLLCGALLVARRYPPVSLKALIVLILVTLAWGLPQLVVALNLAGMPLSPLLILPLLLLA
jgi:hypothetical protein